MGIDIDIVVMIFFGLDLWADGHGFKKIGQISNVNLFINSIILIQH